MRKYFYVLFFIIFISSNLRGQSEIDSLTNLIDSYTASGKQAEVADVFLQLYTKTEQSQDFMALQYAASALQIYTELNDSSRIAYTQRVIGDNYFNRDILAMAMRSYTKSYEIYSLLNDDIELANCHLRIGRIFMAQKLYNKAEESFNNALNIYKTKNKQDGIADVYDDLSKLVLNDQEKDDNDALKLLNDALEIRQKLNDNTLIALSYKNMADAYFYLENYDSVGVFLERALDIYKITGNKLNEADAYYGFGEKYLYDSHYSQAEENYRKALSIYQNENRNEKIAHVYTKLATISSAENKLSEAENFAKEALTISYEYDHIRIRKNALKLLSNIYAKQKNFTVAYKYLNLYTLTRDTIRLEDQNRQSTETQINLTTQKKEQEIKILQEQQKLQKAEQARLEVKQKGMFIGLILFGIIIILVSFTGYYFFKTNKQTKLANALLIEKNEEINQQKEEIQAQRDQVNEANIAITEHRDALELTNEKIQASMLYASRIQRAMQPKMKEIREQLPESFVMLSPKEAVSGDFYWYADFTDDKGNRKQLITAVDCTGHGIPGAFMSMLGDAYLTQIVHQRHIYEPNIILEELHKGIVISLQQNKTNNADGMDVAICIIDQKNKTLEYAGAKNPLVYIQNGNLEIVKADHTSIGGMLRGVERTYQKHTIDISTPTTFYIFSDGFQDQFGGENNKKYMAKRFRDFLYKISSQPINDQAVAVAVELDDWKDQRQQMDDVLVLGVKLDLTK